MLLLALAAALAPVSYYRDIAPVLAFQCNRCHGDELTAGGFDTRTYAAFRKTNLDLLMDLLEGKRGESRRMPREAPPLDAETVAKFRRWIAEGAKEDSDVTPRRTWTAPLEGRALAIACETKTRGYVSLRVEDGSGRELHRTADVVEGKREWTIRRAAHWPPAIKISVTVSYAPDTVIVTFR